MITERTLKKWRKDALIERQILKSAPSTLDAELRIQQQERIVKMSQELLDWHLMRK